MMKTTILPNKTAAGEAAASQAASSLRSILASQPEALLVMATGASQFELLRCLVQEPGIDWPRVTCFHLDEYIGLPITHPASFRKYLKERFADLVPVKKFHYLIGDAPDPLQEIERVNKIILPIPIDLALIGIGENGHLAFNDPPADFETTAPYLVVNLDEACRKQQVGEGWFAGLEDVPRQAISMSIHQIMQSRVIICTVPEARKAVAVQRALEGPVTPTCPASILQTHPASHLYLDVHSASLLKQPV